ncbi:MAG: YgiT-type zinc finger protein [Candidatus Tectimicrobiota bacterium]
MKCLYCQGTMAPGTAPFHIDRHRYHLILDTIPAWVCTQCGEAYFEEAAVEAIQHVIQAVDTSTDKLLLSA